MPDMKTNLVTILSQERLTKQFRKASTERIKSQTQMLIHRCFKMKINILKAQHFKVCTKTPFAEEMLLKFSKVPLGAP